MPDEERQDEPREDAPAPEPEGPEAEGAEPAADPSEAPTTGGEGGDESPEEPAESPEEPAEPPEEPAEEPSEPAEEPAEAPPPPAPVAQERPKDEVVPGAHLEPDLVLEQQQAEEADQYAAYADEEGAAPTAEAPEEQPTAPAAEERTDRAPLELAADARYRATGKRKTSVARVILKPGSGQYSVNGRSLEEYFPRARLQHAARQPLETAGYETRMDVVARIHGGGVSAQAGALRHGVARALVEADPNLRGDLKRRGLLTRDARQKERKKAGLKKARKRPQFSKR